MGCVNGAVVVTFRVETGSNITFFPIMATAGTIIAIISIIIVLEARKMVVLFLLLDQVLSAISQELLDEISRSPVIFKAFEIRVAITSLFRWSYLGIIQ